MIRFFGDIHGRTRDYRQAADEVEYPTVQIGDFGLGFAFNEVRDAFIMNWLKENPKNRFIRGNHDNPSTCLKASGFIPDGTFEDDILFIGGAWSIDYKLRNKGLNWWEDEEASDEVFQKVLEQILEKKPRLIITHDGPPQATMPMFVSQGDSIGGNTLFWNRTSEWLERIFDVWKPEMWIFGHWHRNVIYQNGPTKFICVGSDDYMDLNMKDMHFEFVEGAYIKHIST